MTRLFTDGAEAGDTAPWDVINQGVYSETSTVRIGGRSYKGNNSITHRSISAASEIYFRVAFLVNNSNNANVQIYWLSSGTALGSIRISNNNQNFTINTYVSTSVVHYGTKLFLPLVWYILEGHVKIADAGGVIEYKMDGVLQNTYTGDTKPTAATTVNQFGINTLAFGYYDDIAVNDINGAIDNSWCGDAHIYALAPNANGDSSQLLGSDGNSTDNYALVDEIPSNGDTDYVSSATAGEKDLYNVANLGTLPSGSVIKRVIVESRARELMAEANAIQLGVKSGNTESWSPDIAVTTSYGRQVAEFPVDPNTLVDWTEAGINAMQTGVKIV